MELEELWNNTMSRLKSQIGEQSYSRWLATGSIKTQKNEIIYSAPTNFVKNYVQKNYSALIKSILKEISNSDVAFTIKTGEQTNQNPLPTAENSKIQQKTAENPIQKENFEAKTLKTPAKGQINKDFTFENFVVDDTNRFAFVAAEAVAKNPGSVDNYNPLFLYGGVGLGKTHLIQAIKNYVSEHSEYKKVSYITTETFINGFTEAIKNGEMPSFRNKYRESDILLIDDIHQLRKEAVGTQEELFNTFNALKNKKRQMVFTCDRPAVQLKELQERLSSRLKSGIEINIQMPGYETRVAILQKKVELLKTDIPNEILELIAKNISSNVRELVGALNKIVGYKELLNNKITLEIAQEQLKDIFAAPKQSNVSIDTIIQVVANHFGISKMEITSKKRTQNIAHPRHIAMYITKNLTELSTTEIGQIFGGRDHTTVMHSIDVVENKKKSNPAEEAVIQDLIQTMKEQSVK